MSADPFPAPADGSRAESLIREIAHGVSATTGGDFFRDLVHHLSRTLGLDYALAGEVVRVEGQPRRIRTLAICCGVELMEPLTYDVAGTPCADVLDLGLCSFPHGVRERFPDDEMLLLLGVDGYIGAPLHGAGGEALGLLAVMHRAPIADAGVAGATLRIFAGRAAAELERLRVEAELAERESVYRAMFEENRAVKLLIDPADGALVDANGAACDFYGYSREELRRLRITDINTLPADEVRRLLQAAVSRGRFNSEFRHRLKSGEVRDVEVWSGPIEIRGRRLLFSIVHDITERKAAEQALRESEEKYRRLFEQSRDAVFLVGAAGDVLDANPAGLELLGFASRDELGAVDVWRDLCADPRARRRVGAELREQGFARDFEAEVRRRNGRLATVVGTISTLRDTGGRALAYLAILRDVTTQRALEEQLRQAQKMEAVGRLAGGLAHDFNNLLTAINGYGELLYFQLPEGDRLRTFVQEIRQAGRRATELTAKLLTLSRRKVVSPQRVDLNVVVRNLEGLLRRLIGEDVELTTRLQPELGTVRVDPGEIEQVILNLAVNARDAMPTGGLLTLETGDVDLAADGVLRNLLAAPGGGLVRLSLRDTGVGIEPEVQQHIFEPFFTTKEHGKGTGLGLSTVYATVRQSGGHVTVESTPGEGAAFHVYLPRVAGEPAPREAPARRREVSGGDETVLLVEDDAGVRQLVRRLLEQQGYSVLEAEDAATALDRVERHGSGIDLLLSDVVMPGMSGPELAARLRPAMPELRILFISGYTDSFVVQHGLSAADHVVLQKPFSAEALAERVREVLDAPPHRGVEAG